VLLLSLEGGNWFFFGDIGTLPLELEGGNGPGFGESGM
jgi:hypothetical protein